MKMLSSFWPCCSLAALASTAAMFVAACTVHDGATSSSTTHASSTGTSGAGGSAAAPFRVALSVSPFTSVIFKTGATFSDGQTTATDLTSLEQMYVSHGATELFARIATYRTPNGTSDDHSQKTAVERATLAKSLGLTFNPELGLWAHYGDISCEPAPDFSEFPELSVPGPWNKLTVDQMVPVLRAYGSIVATEILATGTTVEIWDIGNEVDLGTAGVAPRGINCSTPYTAPDGVDPVIGTKTVIDLLSMTEVDRINWLTAHVWPHEARLLGAVADGIRDVDPKARFATHMSQSLSATYALAFYDAMALGGFSPDEFGFSYYPSATNGPDRAARFKDTVVQVQDHFKKPAFIAEVAYPAGPTTGGIYDTWTNAIPAYPIGEEGQAAFVRDLASWAKASGVSGIRYWAPELFAPGWQGFALFAPPPSNTYPVVARKALDGIRQGIASPDAAAFHD